MQDVSLSFVLLVRPSHIESANRMEAGSSDED